MVKKAIQDAGGNLTRASILLGCTRPTLYTWIYQLGLERLAGIRLDTRHRLNERDRIDNRTSEREKPGVKSGRENGPIFSLVQGQKDGPVQATVKIRESLWKEAKIEAIRRDTTVAALVEQGLQLILQGRKMRAADGQ